MNAWLRDLFRDRPAWMNALMVFSAYMAFIYMPWDLFAKPVAVDQEVWFGILFTGWWAKVLEIPHWFVYGAATYGFRHRRPWMRTWGALYVAQISLGMWVWSIRELGGALGWIGGLVPAIPFAWLAWRLNRAEREFDGGKRSLRERYGEWALVTGASAGIGAEFARALARDGISCVLTARREERLRGLAAELEKDFNVATRTVAVDLAQPEAVDRLLAQVSDLAIDVLVNNAGVGYAGRFEKLDPKRLQQLVQLNCTAPMLLTRALVPAMRERGRGAVIITGSVAGRQPLPLHGVYSASKAFDLFLGESLYAELRGTGVDVIVLEPGSTETEFQEVAGEIAHAGVSPARVVEVALDALGRQPSVISTWFEWLRITFATRFGSRPLTLHIAHDVIAKQTPSQSR